MQTSTRETPAGPTPERAVRRELARALGGLASRAIHLFLLPLRKPALVRALRTDLASSAEPVEAPRCRLPKRPLRIFLSSAEASGEAHALHLVSHLVAAAREAGAPPPEFSALGGERSAAQGIRIIGDPVSRAAMGVDVLRSISFYRDLLERTAAHLREERPDVCVPVDSPALHVPLGRIARAYGIPVVHYVTPQYWAWAPWRVKGYREAVDLALTILPFEPSWFARHGVRAAHIGHPQADLLEKVPRAEESADGGTLVLLPGSRRSVIARNLPWMITVASHLRLVHPDIEVVLPHDREDLEPDLARILTASGAQDWIRIAPGSLHDELRRARLALSVSGTILLDLLHHRVPTAVIYRLSNRFTVFVGRRLLTVPFFSSVNLIAGKEVLPEFLFSGDGPLEVVSELLSRWIRGGPEREEVLEGLERAAARLGGAGAARRAAGHILGAAVSGDEHDARG